MIAAGQSPLRVAVLADGAVAQPAFEALLAGGWVAGLCTLPASESGAGLRHLARHAEVPICEATRDVTAGGLDRWLNDLRPDVLLVFAFPYRLPGSVLRVPRLGAFNMHGGRLPCYRGPQPVFWEIRNREPEGAVTVHRMDEALDRGAIVASHSVPIAPEDTHGLHTVRLAFVAVRVVETLLGGLLQYGAELPTQPQEEAAAAFHRRPAFDDLVIRWDDCSGAEIRALVKAGNPWNHGAFASVRGVDVRLADVTLIEAGGQASAPPGAILAADPQGGTLVNCRDGSALLLDVVSMREGLLPGRTLAAYGIRAGDRFVTPSRR